MQPWYEEYAEKFGSQMRVGEKWISSRDLAPLIGKSKNTALAFLNWYKQQFADGVAAPESLSVSDKSKTWVDERSGTVFTDLGDYGLISFTQGEFRSIKRDYSRHYGGQALTRQEIALRYRFPTIKAFEVFAKIHELRQNGLPFTDTELLEEGADALADKAIESQRQAFFTKLNTKEQELLKRDAEKWRAFEVNAALIASELRGLVQSSKTPLSLKTPPTTSDPFAAFVCLSDVHYGKLDVDRYGKTVYNREIAAEIVRAATRDLLAQTLMLGTPEEIILLAGGSDYLHADGPKLLTSSLLTNQGAQSDGTYRQILTGGAALMIEVVKMCRAIAPVRLVEVPGNHDAQSSLFMAMLLKEAFAGDEHVTIESGDGGRVLIEYGASSLYFLHGDNLKKETDLFKLMLHDAEERGTYLRKFRLAFSGHLHGERTNDLGGIKHHVCSALTGSDEWHREMGFLANTREAQSFIIRKSGGKAAVLYSSPAVLSVA